MEYVRYNPTDEFYKSIVGAVEEGASFSIRLQLRQVVNPSKVKLVVFDDGGKFNKEFPMYFDRSSDGYDNYVVDVQFNKGLYWYYFMLDGVDYERYVGLGERQHASLYYDNVRPWQLSVYKKIYETPSWLNKGVMYQIMVDRFCASGDTMPTEDKVMRSWGEQPYYREENGVVRNRDFFGGNLKGLTSKLDYLVSLNVKTLYLNPIFKAYSNHKYDTEDYEVIDPMFGNLEDFTTLCQQAAKRDIKVILDGVFNHVGSSSKYFRSAYTDANSPYRDWFNIHADGSYECWWNFKTLPRLNANSPTVQKFFTSKNGIVRKWLAAGASGWRLDVVDEVADPMLDKIVSAAKTEKSDAAIIGEVWEDASNKVDYGVRRHYLDGSQLDSVMNYPLRNGIVDFVRDGNEQTLARVVFDIVNNYPSYVRNNLMNILGTHDTVRILTNLAGKCLDHESKDVMASTKLSDAQYKNGIELLKMAAVLQYTLFGFPCVYYGDEVAMEGYKDPFCRGCYPWGKENKLMLDFYRRLGELRKLAVFSDGDFHELVAERGVYAFERVDAANGVKVIVALNRGHFNYSLYLDDFYEDVLTGRSHNESCQVPVNGFVILKNVK